MRTVDVTLGGVTYRVPELTVGDFEDISEAVAAGGNNTKVNSRILEIALARAEPKLEGSVRDIQTNFEELAAAVTAILDLAKVKQQNPQQATQPVA